MTIPFQTDIAKRETLTAMLGVYRQAVQDIEAAYDLLEKAQGRLRSAFMDTPGYSFSTNERNLYDRVGKKAAEAILKNIKKDAWRHIVERMELRRLLSIKRRDELDRQMERSEDLPELTEENILSMFQQSAANVNTYLEEAVKEVFEYLRPPQSHLKTNTEFEIGRKVILSWVVEKGWNRGKYKVNYHREKYIVAIQNVMQMLDGKGPVKEYHGELYGAICDSPDGKGETPYFKFKSFMNGNLHLEFKREDLLARLNSIAGGNRLKTDAEDAKRSGGR
jgi:hypothetical protein